jgi:simple sugar transport system ATP-binding protein
LPIRELRGVAKHFGAIQDLSGVILTLEAGEAPGLMDDNGAGKSTFVKGIAGNFAATHGEILIGGEPVHFSMPVEARQKGVETASLDVAWTNKRFQVSGRGRRQ